MLDASVRLVSARPNVPDHLRVRRKAERGVYDRTVIDAIFDEALYCHVGFVADGRPVVIPTLHARVGDRLYLHGASGNRMLRTAAAGGQICVTATLVDGLVLAKSVFHHSINYRSAVVMGVASVVEGDEKRAALRAFTDHVAPGRWEETRQPTETELVQTSILSLPLDEVSAKVREGPPSERAGRAGCRRGRFSPVRVCDGCRGDDRCRGGGGRGSGDGSLRGGGSHGRGATRPLRKRRRGLAARLASRTEPAPAGTLLAALAGRRQLLLEPRDRCDVDAAGLVGAVPDPRHRALDEAGACLGELRRLAQLRSVQAKDLLCRRDRPKVYRQRAA
jgi:uncharacterized protein